MGMVKAFVGFIVFPLLGVFFALVSEFMWNNQGWGGVFLGSGISLEMVMIGVFLAFLIAGLIVGIFEAIKGGSPWS